ncbi:MAG TPA: DMT family transporter [Bryobacteraceae bacterium]|nr:DMT family transporter [Bryobacteraceae bacterium]
MKLAKPRRWQADLSLGLVALVWGSTFVIVKGVLADISTLYFLALRFAIAAVCLLLIFWHPFSRVPVRKVWHGIRGGMAAGAFLWLGYVLQTFGLKYTTAGNSGFLTGLYVILVPLLGAILYRRRPQSWEFGGILLATAGMLLLTLPATRSSWHMNKGDLLTLGCAVAFAFHLLILGYFSQREMFQAVALGQVAFAALLSAGSLAVEPPQARWTQGVVLAILLTAVFATALAFALQTWGQKYTTPTRTALILALEPVFALVTAVLFAHENLTLAGVFGGILILAGILMVELKPRIET